MGAVVQNPRINVDGQDYEMELAIIERTTLGYNDHGSVSAHLHVGGLAWGQSVGGYRMDTPEPEDSPRFAHGVKRRGLAVGMDHIIRILDVVGCDHWEYLVRKRVFVIREHAYGKIIGLANIDKPEQKFMMLDGSYEEFLKLTGEE